ncbi:MAG: purine-nucleoside phosphorylase [Xanthomonadales bacterium]|nr:purine-nucleoside phosphorylase [Xanthomonadales bacterium]
MGTPHISAKPGDFAETVLLPGDPLRALHIATTLLDDAVEVTRVRAMGGYTGTWRGRRVSVMGTGMGIPSSSIYATELVREYGVKRLVRIGTCGGVADSLQLGDIVLGIGACTDSGVNRARFKGMDYAAVASYGLLAAVANEAQRQNIAVQVGNLFSADLFYGPDPTMVDTLAAMNILGIEMEAAGLYGLAAQYGAEALTVCAVSDHLRTHQSWSPEQRQLGVDAMVRLVLEAVVGA